MMTATRQSTAASELAERDRARKQENRERRLRVEALGIPHCLVCGGVDPDHDPKVSDPVLRCVCAERRQSLQARCLRIVHELRDGSDDLANRIAP